MLRILHGENIIQSRNELAKCIEQAKSNQQDVVRLDAKKTTLPELEQALGSPSLFGNSQVVIIEALHSLPRSKKKDALISLIADSNKNSETECILWEKRSLTATMLKKFPEAKDTLFKLSNQLFKWLDTLSPDKKTKITQLKTLHQAIEGNGDHMCFVMLIRQVRLLIQAKENGTIKGAPFMIAKLKKQAQKFTLDQLLNLHSQLQRFDLELKTSKNTLSLQQNLDLLLINL